MLKNLMMTVLCLSLAACQSIALNQEDHSEPRVETQDSAFIATLKVGAEPHGIAASMNFVYSANTADQSLSVIDARTHELVKTVTFSEGGPTSLAVSPDQERVLISNSEAGQVHLLSPSQDHQIIKTWTVGKGPDNLQISSDNRFAFIALTGEDQLVQIDLSNLDAELQRHQIGAGSADGHAYRALALGQQWLAVSNPGDNNLSLLNLESREVRSVSAGNDPSSLGFSTEKGYDQKLLIGNKASHTVSIYDLNSHTNTTLSDLGLSPTEILVINDLKRAYVSMSGSNQVAVLDFNKIRLVGKVNVGERPVHLYREPPLLRLQHEEGGGERVWVGNDSGQSVSVIDAQTLALTNTYSVGQGHHKMAFAQNQCFVSNFADHTLTVLKQ